MSTTIDERVVAMRFDNKHFENNVSTTLSSLDKLKQSLNLTGASKGLENVSSAAKNCDMSVLSGAVESVKARFSALQVMGVTALANITNSAVNAGKRIVSALTIDPIKTGFQEYETQINAVQTILANTSHAGTDLQDVNRVLDELNEYADKTIYNFTQMTRNIGTFTAAGVDLETSASAIQGIANLAAVSGSTSQQASTAMYQLSQAIANGKVNLQDWNSVVNAGMGGKVFQDALVKTAAAMEGVTEETFRANNITGSFRESINSKDGTGWLTSDILVKTLTQFTMAAEEGTEQWKAYKKALMSEGYTETQAEEILKMANTATDAATKVKTFTQLWDTLKESAQSGWTQTWEIMVGDFEEAKDFLTKISDTVGGMINESSKARNELFSGAFSSGWKQLLGAGISDEEGFMDTIKNVSKKHGVNFDKMSKDNETFEQTLVRGLKNGKINADMLSESVTTMANKMSKMSAEELEAAGYTQEHADQMKALSKGLKDGSVSMDEFVDKMMKPSGRQNIIDSLWNAFDGLMSVVKPIKEAFSDIFPAVTSDQLYKITENLKKFTEGLTISADTSDKIKRTFKGLFSILDLLRKGVTAVVDGLFDLSQSDGIKSLADFVLDAAASIGDFFTSLNDGFDTDGLTGVVSKIATTISDLIGGTVKGLEGFGDILKKIGDFITKVATKIWDVIKTVFSWIADNFSVADIFAGLAGGGIFMAAKKASGFLDKILDIFKGLFDKKSSSSLKENFAEILGSVKDSLDSFTSGIKVWSLVGIAAAVALLSSSLKKISELDATDIGKSLFAIGTMIGMLTTSFKSITKSLSSFQSKGVVKAGLSMILIAKAIDILADAMVKLADLKLTEIGKGLIAMGGGLGELVLGMKALNKVKIDLKTSVAMLALAKSCEMLADALKSFSEMQWDEIGRGLTAMGGALAEFVLALKGLDKVGGTNSLLGSGSLVIAVESLDELAAGLKKFGEMSWDEIGRGLAGMGGALAEVGTVTGALGYLTGFSGVLGGGSLVVAVQSLSDLADGLKKFGEMSWDEIGRGLAGMGGALAEIGTVTGLVGGLTGFSGVLGGGALVVAVQSLGDLADGLKKFGEMSWDEIGRGLTAMGGALTEVGVVSGALGYLTGIAGVFGAGTIWVAVQGLDDLANSFKKFGEMSWEEIGRGLVGMGGALTEVGVITGALGYLTNFAGILGAASLWTAIQGLGDLADAFKKFGEMSWDEIGRGLTAMGGALDEVALGGFMSTLSGLGAMAIGEIAEPLGVLADSLKKWKDVTVPENLGWDLSNLANGVFSFTFGGSGASALATVAPAIGQMADSVKKWEDVTVPEGLAGQISGLTDALSGWWNEGMGASAMATAAPAIGQMADSIKKWSDVTVPEGLKDDLTGIASGVQAFSFAFAGGWSLHAIIGPLGDFAGTISKWSDVKVPSKMGENLEDLAAGINAFSFAFMGGWSLSAITGPLGDLAEDVKKWNGVKVPAKLSDQLTSLADGVKSFSWAFMGGWSLSTITGPLGDLAVSVKKWKDVSIPKSLSTSMTTLATSIGKLSDINYQAIGSGLSGLHIKMKDFASNLMDSISDGMLKKEKTITSTMESIISSMINSIDKKKILFNVAGIETISKFINGVNSGRNRIDNTMYSVISAALTEARSYYINFYNAGSYLVTGFANGISSNRYAAAAKAKAMAAAAAQAARDELDEHSPSKVGYEIGDFFGVAFVNALDDNVKKAYKASAGVAKSAITGISDAISKTRDMVELGIDSQPTIRPVLDLSDVESGAGVINGLLGVNPSVGVLSNIKSIGTMIDKRNQNGVNDDVVSALKDLKKTIGSTSGNTYTINGITYDDGSNITEAVKALIRAANVERRV